MSSVHILQKSVPGFTTLRKTYLTLSTHVTTNFLSAMMIHYVMEVLSEGEGENLRIFL